MLQEHGTPWQREFFLPRILAGEMHFAIGYTEPDAGTDLAALRTSAVRDGEEYVVNGQKIFTTGAHDGRLHLAGLPHRPGRAPAQGDHHPDRATPTTRVLLDADHHPRRRPPRQRDLLRSGVRVPVRMRVGAENGGWRLITSQLNHERVMLGPAGRIAAMHDRVRDWAAAAVAALRSRTCGGRWPGPTPSCASTSCSTGRWRRRPELSIADASATKVFSSEQAQLIGQSLAEVVGRHGDPADPDTAALMTWLDVQLKRNTVLTFGGGVNEVQRELIATAGLGLPRVPR